MHHTDYTSLLVHFLLADILILQRSFALCECIADEDGGR